MHAAAAIADGTSVGRARRAHVSFGVTAAVCLATFAWMESFGTFHLVADDSFGSFYDHQAAAWLRGRWDVPEASLSEESFVVADKVYGYFGPTPAVMRLPFLLLGFGFGEVTRLLMLLDYAACLGGTYALLWLATRWRDAAAIPTVFTTVLVTATAGLGSTLFFLGSRAYVYHEAILCGVAFALWSVFFGLRYLQAPAARGWIGALLCGVLAVQARPPVGLFALSVLGAAATLTAFARRRGGSRLVLRHLGHAGLAAAGILSFNAVSYIKFGTFNGCPLHFNVQYTAEQMAALEHSNFHFSNLRFNTDAYLLRPAFSVDDTFPYVYREYLDRREYKGSKMAYRDPTLAIPWSMPGLFYLTLIGTVLALATPGLRLPLAVLWLAAIPTGLAMLTAVSVTQRYTADFCPFLIAAAAFTPAAVDILPPFLRGVVRIHAGTFALLGVLVMFALTLHHQRNIVWGVPAEAQDEYQRWRAWLRRGSKWD